MPLELQSLEPRLALAVADTLAPFVKSIAAPLAKTYAVGSTLSFKAMFSENIIVTGAPTLPITIGDTVRQATWDGKGSGGRALVFKTTVQAGDFAPSGVSIAGPIELSGATIRDKAGNAVIPAATGTFAKAKVDAVGPSVTAFGAATITPKLVSVQVRFSEPVTIKGKPTIPFTLAGVAKQLGYKSGSGTKVLTFTYKPAKEEAPTAANVNVPTQAISLNGGAITDKVGNVVSSLAEPTDVYAAVSTDFTFQNLTSHALKLVGWHDKNGTFLGKDGIETPIKTGIVVQPGDKFYVTLTKYLFLQNDPEFYFDPVDPPVSGRFTIQATSNAILANTNVASFARVVEPGNWVFAPNSRDDLILLDPPGTVVTLNGRQGQRQADVLNQLSELGDGVVSSTFKDTAFDDKAWTPKAVLGAPVSNDTTSELVTSFTATHQVQTAFNIKVGLEAKGKLFKIVETALKTELGVTLTDSQTFSQAVTLKAQPGQTVALIVQYPVLRVTGDYTAVVGNTTYILTGVSFDSPDPSRSFKYDAVVVHLVPEPISRPMALR